jgi:hypothetical protein
LKDLEIQDCGEKQWKLKKKDVDLLMLTSKTQKEKDTWISQFKSAQSNDKSIAVVRVEELQQQQVF